MKFGFIFCRNELLLAWAVMAAAGARCKKSPSQTLGMSQFLIKVVGDDNNEAALSADDSVEGWWLDVLQVLCSALSAWTLFHVSVCGWLLDFYTCYSVEYPEKLKEKQPEQKSTKTINTVACGQLSSRIRFNGNNLIMLVGKNAEILMTLRRRAYCLNTDGLCSVRLLSWLKSGEEQRLQWHLHLDLWGKCQ